MSLCPTVVVPVPCKRIVRHEAACAVRPEGASEFALSKFISIYAPSNDRKNASQPRGAHAGTINLLDTPLCVAYCFPGSKEALLILFNSQLIRYVLKHILKVHGVRKKLILRFSATKSEINIPCQKFR